MSSSSEWDAVVTPVDELWNLETLTRALYHSKGKADSLWKWQAN